MEADTASLGAPQKSKPHINTYHCICSTLLLATTRSLASLHRRTAPGLDKAYILPMPPLSKLAAESAEEDDTERQNKDRVAIGYSLLLSTTQDRKPTIVRREDGFEKRILLRCGRCRLVIGYKLDATHFTPSESEIAGGPGGQGAEETKGGGEGAEVVYLLPGALVSSEDLKIDKTPDLVDWKEWDSRFA